MPIYACGFNGFGQLLNQNSDDVCVATLFHPFDSAAFQTEGLILDNLCHDETQTLALGSKTFTGTGSEELHELVTTKSRSTELSTRNKILTMVVPCWQCVIVACDGQTYVSGHTASTRSQLCQLYKEPAVSVASSWNHIYMVTQSGKCLVWPHAQYGNTPTQIYVQTPDSEKEKERSESKFLQVGSGEMQTVAITDGGTAGRIEEQYDTPVLFRPFHWRVKIKAVSCGKEHTLLLSRIGAVFSFGIGSRGQLGHGSTENQSEPRIVEALDGVMMSSISAGGWHSAAISDIGDLYMWGWNASGQLGMRCSDGQGSSESHTTESGQIDRGPVVNMQTVPCVLDLETNRADISVSRVSCGSRHTAAVTDEGEVYTWGWNGYGQLGLADRIRRDSPTRVRLLSDKNQVTVTDVSCGAWNTFIFAET